MQEETVTEEVDETQISDDASNNVQIGEVVTDIEYIPIEVNIKLHNTLHIKVLEEIHYWKM